jgi:hypothetical protein
MRAQRRTTPQEVWRYVTLNAVPRWVLACTLLEDGELFLLRRSGKQRIESGEWLIQNLDGEPEWLPDKDFRRDYALV